MLLDHPFTLTQKSPHPWAYIQPGQISRMFSGQILHTQGPQDRDREVDRYDQEYYGDVGLVGQVEVPG